MAPDPAPERLELGIGQSAELELVGLGTAGYQWRQEVEGADVVSVTWSRGSAHDSDVRVAGSSPPEIATIRGIKSGRAVVRLAQTRAWERNTEPLNTRTIEVRVQVR